MRHPEIAAPILILVGLVSCATRLHLEYAPDQVATTADRGMVVAEDPIAAEVGAAILREGGNAVDAAVATAFALAATLPQAGNPGGGGFAVISMPGGEPIALDFRETAPAAAHRDMFLRANGNVDSRVALWTPLAAGVPGNPAGLHALHRRLGRLPWARVVSPAVRLAREGFAIGAGLADALNTHRKRFLLDLEAARIFVRENRPWRAGDLLVQEDLAGTLAAIRERGAAGFYRGPFARAVGDGLPGGVLTAADLASYRPIWRPPARFEYRGREVVTMPLPSSGGVVLSQALGILEAAGGGETAPGSADRLHLFAEAERRAFADRNAHLGDPAGVPAGLTDALREPNYIASRAGTIDPVRATPSAGVSPGLESDSTTNLVVVDRDGGAVALTFTLNATFGTHIVVPGTGVILNNEMDDFAAKPGEPNQFGLRQGERNIIVPGRRPLSSMSPTLVRDRDRVVLAVGSPGGPRILTAVALMIIRHIGDGLPLDLAVLAPRSHHQHLPDVLFIEDADVVWPEGRQRQDLLLSRGKLKDLSRRGHELRKRKDGIGRVTAISVDLDTGEVTGVADPRTYGSAVSE